MGKKIPDVVSFNLPDGREVQIETGKLATQAHGSVVVRMGKTMLFASVVSSTELREGQSFFPLSVDYQEKYASVGRIPGNFFRREARLSESEILTCRLVDRAIRPLFPDGYMYETQIAINLISGDVDDMPDALAALAASAALTVSDIPFAGPISEVRVSKVDGEYVVNPSKTQNSRATLDIILAATMDNVMMVEGEMKECSEEEVIEAIKVGHDAIKVQCQAQLDLAKLINVGENRPFEVEAMDEDLWNEVEALGKDKIYDVFKSFLGKFDRKDQLKAVKTYIKESLEEKLGEEAYAEQESKISAYCDKLTKKVIRDTVLKERVRLDGRKTDQVRPIWTEIDYLPAAHGSAIFNRGETQTLCTATLGTKMDQQMVDTVLEKKYSKFILHYNFPAYSVGESRPNRGPGRREIGHANLANRSLKQVLPDESPYTIRILSDVLESNGSSSMATVCGGSLALMDAGIKIKAPVSGIAMGMISEGDDYAILTDILGDEDAVGDMDFKVTGTRKGICACQMDIKVDGLSYEVLGKALAQAKDGRLHILDEMAKTMDEPRNDLKPFAPRIVEVIIDKSFIGAVIGPGGKIIQEMQADTNTIITIDEVDDKGVVNIAASNKADIDAAVAKINDIAFMPSVGDEYDAVVASIMPYGAFVDFKGKSGLLHISEIEHRRLNTVEEVLKQGDEVRIKLIAIDQKTGKLKLSRKVLLPKPEKA